MVIAAAITSAFALRRRALSKMNVCAFFRYSFSSEISLSSPHKSDRERNCSSKGDELC